MALLNSIFQKTTANQNPDPNQVPQQPVDMSTNQQMSVQPAMPVMDSNQTPQQPMMDPNQVPQQPVPGSPAAMMAAASVAPIAVDPNQVSMSAQSPAPAMPSQPTIADPNQMMAVAPTAPTPSAVDPLASQDMTILSHLDPRASQVVASAYGEAKRLTRQTIDPEQLLFGLLADREVLKLMQDFTLDLAALTRELQSLPAGGFNGEPILADDTKQILEESYSQAQSRGVEFVTPEDILLALFTKSVSATANLTHQGVDRTKIEEKLAKSPEFKTGRKSVLSKYGSDLVEKAKAGQLDPVTGRDKEVERLVHILLRRTKNNPIVIGEPGVGKTAIVEGLAQLIASGKVAPDLANKKVIQLDVSSLVAGASHRGEFEERLNNVIKEVMMSSGQIILFIDEIHTLMGAGASDGTMDASNIIKPYLGRGQIQIIGATTTSEFRKYFEKDRAFERRFQPIFCEEPAEDVAIEMIKILQPKYEKFHRVTFLPDSIIAAVKLSKRYIGERFLPDKAIDLMDEAAAEVKLAQAAGKRTDVQIRPEDIQNVVSRWTGIPITKLTEKEGEKLLHMEELIHEKFINHEPAVKAVSEAIRRGRIGLANANRPIASFIFLGPTGTGKTELAKVIAEILFGKSDAMIRLDMSEYMEKHEVAKLLGAPPGYVGYEEGGQLTEAVRTKPYSIVLLDEVEKAHPDVFNILLQLLEDGRLTDNKGNTVSFKNTVVIATSNIGSNLIQEKLQKSHQTVSSSQQQGGDGQVSAGVAMEIPEESQQSVVGSQQPAEGQEQQDQSVEGQQMIEGGQEQPQDQQVTTPQESPEQVFKELQKMLMDELLKFFRPELVNRFDEVVTFEPLTQENMLAIAKLQLLSTGKMLKDQNIEIKVSDVALNQLAKEGYDPVYGARPLRRLVQRVIENPIAIYLINQTFKAGDTIDIDYVAAEDRYSFVKASQQSQANGQQLGNANQGQDPVVQSQQTAISENVVQREVLASSVDQPASIESVPMVNTETVAPQMPEPEPIMDQPPVVVTDLNAPIIPPSIEPSVNVEQPPVVANPIIATSPVDPNAGILSPAVSTVPTVDPNLTPAAPAGNLLSMLPHPVDPNAPAPLVSDVGNGVN